MGSIELVDTFPFWKAVLWIFYPIATIMVLEFVSDLTDNDDDDFDGGKMIPAYQGARG